MPPLRHPLRHPVPILDSRFGQRLVIARLTALAGRGRRIIGGERIMENGEWNGE